MNKPPSDFLYQSLPVDPDNQTLLANEHPLNWINPRPKKIYDLIVIGAGPAGLIAAMTGINKGKTVALIERDLLGGEHPLQRTGGGERRPRPLAHAAQSPHSLPLGGGPLEPGRAGRLAPR